MSADLTLALSAVLELEYALARAAKAIQALTKTLRDLQARPTDDDDIPF